MSLDWSNLLFTPDARALQELASFWEWLLNEPYEPVMFSTLGDVFFRRDSGGIFWLNTGTGELEKIAESEGEFRQLLDSPIAEEWFLPQLVSSLRASGKVLRPCQCYTYVRLPVFAEGMYETSNLNPVSAAEHFSLTGKVHRQLQSASEGSHVRVNFR